MMNLLIFSLLCCSLIIQLSVGSVVEDYDYGSNDYQQQMLPESVFRSSKKNIKSNSDKFATDLYKQMIKDEPKSIVFSPLSIQTSLALAMFGAVGETKQDIKIAMHYGNSSDEDILKNFRSLSLIINGTDGLKIANKVYIANGYTIKPNFSEIAKKNFDSDTENVNFTKKQETASKINQWVEQRTNNKIKDLISPNFLNRDTKMVLINAIYFKGIWEKKFVPERTGRKNFYLNANDNVLVDMMEIESNYKYGKNFELNADIIELPYKESDISMMIFLPFDKSNLSDLEDKIDEINIQALSNGLYFEDVIVELPKFRIEFEISLKEPLIDMGMQKMFSNSDFSELLVPSELLSISEAVHKSYIDVNEEGAEAAAATGFVFQRRSGFIEEKVPIYFRADHPFMFVLKSSTETLIMGRFNGY